MLALQAANVGADDEVLVPTMTMIAVGNAVHFLGAKPIFVDNDPDNKYNPGWDQIMRAAEHATKVKAVIVCHMYGVPCSDTRIIKEGCRSRGWILIEDISECVGVRDHDGSMLGTVGDFAAASLYANKIIHAADGGFVLAASPDAGDRLKSLANHGFTPKFHFVHFENAINAKINGLGAAMACGTIKHLDEAIENRSAIANTYREGLKQWERIYYTSMPRAGKLDSPWVYGIELRDMETRTILRAELAKYGIETRDYFFPQHLQPAFKGHQGNQRLPVAEDLGSRSVYLPTHIGMSLKTVSFIADVIVHFFVKDPWDCNPQVHVTLTTTETLYKGQPVQIPAFHYSNGKNDTHYSIMKIIIDFDEYLKEETTSAREKLILDIDNALDMKITANGNLIQMIQTLRNYLVKVQGQELWLPRVEPRPWLAVDLNTFPRSSQIFTTSNPDLLKTLSWCVQEFQPRKILEVGSLFGHTMMLMLESSDCIEMINCVDPFKWIDWMSQHIPDGARQNGQDFKQEVLDQLPSMWKNKVNLLQYHLGKDELSEEDGEILHKTEYDLVFLDFTQKELEFKLVWSQIKDQLISDHSLILVNGLTRDSIGFFTDVSENLQAVAKPDKKSKLFRYVVPAEETPVVKVLEDEVVEEDQGQQNDDFIILDRNLKIEYNPEWSHHHQNAFRQAVHALKDELHSDEADAVVFIAAVEQYICDADEVLNKPWIGIIHNVISLPSLYYVPDLKRLCSEEGLYRPWFKHCKGLFTWTSVQADYLRTNLPVKIPVQKLKYPMAVPLPQLQTVKALKVNGVKAVLIGSFLRDFDYFFNVKLPSGLQKALLVGEEQDVTSKAKELGIKVLPRAEADEYERLIRDNLVFLSLKDDGAANTLLVECIARNVPLVCPRISSVTEYIGEGYPLLYDQGQMDLTDLITDEVIEKATIYLSSMDKWHLNQQAFVQAIKDSTVMRYIPANVIDKKFAVTVSICSYRRTHHLGQILNSVYHQSISKHVRIQIVVWNNNDDRADLVRRICQPYMIRNNKTRSLELIQTSDNHYAAIRLALPPLVKSSRILICDDDIIPGEDFVKFFMEASFNHPKDILCVRGHQFLKHDLKSSNPELEWRNYKNLRFVDDHEPEQLLHFVHSDVAMVPTEVLRKVSAEEMPDDDFDLVDDYWFSFVANHKHGVKLRKLEIPEGLMVRTDDSETKGLALHTRSDVSDARMRMYIHHMLHGWPKVIDPYEALGKITDLIRKDKKEKIERFKTGRYVGYNVSSDISDQDADVLVKDFNVHVVKVGAVGAKGLDNYEFQILAEQRSRSEFLLTAFLDKMGERGVDVLITLEDRVASPDLWQFVASICSTKANVIGYDLINEPHTINDLDSHYLEVSSEGFECEVMTRYKAMMKAIRMVDNVTAIIMEPSFWGSSYSLDFLTIGDPEVIASVHFYEPRALTWGHQMPCPDSGVVRFPGDIPIYPWNKANHKDVVWWDRSKLRSRIQKISDWAKLTKSTVFIGELGIARNTPGAENYLETALEACYDFNIGVLVYAFREKHWEKMNYEMGSTEAIQESNRMIKVIKNAINKMSY